MLLDPSLEQRAVDCTLHTKRLHKAGRTQGSQKSGRFPTAVRHRLDQALSALASTISACHVRLGPCFIDENDSVRIDHQLLGNPLPTRFGDILPVLLGRDTRLFFCVRRSARQARLRVTSETFQPSSSFAAATNSRK